MSTQGKVGNGADKKGGQGIYIVVGLLVVVIIVMVIGIVFVSQNGIRSQNETTTMKRNVVVNKDNVDEVVGEIADSNIGFVAPGSYEVVMNSTWYFRNGKDASSNAYVENVLSNTNDVYFDVMLADSDMIIYESPVIPRGAYLDNITLDKPLDVGTYDCLLVYHLIDENQKTVSTLTMTLTIVIEG